MISVIYVFWMFVILFAVIGMLRGWAKELLVGFAVVVAVALNFLLHSYAPMVKDLQPDNPTLFWVQTIVLGTLVYFGYQTVISIARLQAGARRERLQDSLFGLFLGALNGYLVMGTFWSYWAAAGYPGGFYVKPTDQAILDAMDKMINVMPPHLLGAPGIYFAVIVVLIFILVVYV